MDNSSWRPIHLSWAAIRFIAIALKFAETPLRLLSGSCKGSTVSLLKGIPQFIHPNGDIFHKILAHFQEERPVIIEARAEQRVHPGVVLLHSQPMARFYGQNFFQIKAQPLRQIIRRQKTRGFDQWRICLVE